MARKKRQTYSDMVRSMADIQKKIISEKDRMAEVLASELDYDTALRLGDLSESELRRVARFMFDHIELFVNLAKLNVPESKRSQDAEDGSTVEGELRYDHAKNCWDIRDRETDQLVGKLRDGMCVDFRDADGKGWEPVKIRMTVSDMWYMMKNGSPVLMFDGLQVRIHTAKA